jgi:cell division protein FtsL
MHMWYVYMMISMLMILVTGYGVRKATLFDTHKRMEGAMDRFNNEWRRWQYIHAKQSKEINALRMECARLKLSTDESELSTVSPTPSASEGEEEAQSCQCQLEEITP